MDRAGIVHENFLARVASRDLPEVSDSLETSGLSLGDLRRLLWAQAMSRQLDRIARILQKRGQGFYTIGSSGHEGIWQALLRP